MPAGRHRARPDRRASLTVALSVAVAVLGTVVVLAPQPTVQPKAHAAVQRYDEPRPSRSYARPSPALPRWRGSPPAHHRAGGEFSSPEPVERPVKRFASLNPDRAVVVAWALSQLGKPYVWGADGPDAYDCSGLVLAAFAHAGYTMPRYSGDQHAMGNAVPLSRLDPGDLVAWPGHVAIYLGRGRVVEAALPGTTVRVRALGNSFDLAAWGVSLDYGRLPR